MMKQNQAMHDSNTSKSSGSHSPNGSRNKDGQPPYWAAYNRFLQELLVVGVMPFMYGAATRLPFIYFVIHLDFHFHLDFLTIGLYVAAYQGCRVITSGCACYIPKLSHVVGTAAGLTGYIIVYCSDKDLVAPFAAGTAIIGLSETMSSMQKYTKELYKFHPDRKKTKLMLKYQYALVMLGVMFAFSIGGFVYQYEGINGVALFGALVEGCGLQAVLLFFVLQWFLPVEAPPDFIDVGGKDVLDTEANAITNANGGLPTVSEHTVGLYFNRTKDGRVVVNDEVDVDALISGLLKIQSLAKNSGHTRASSHHPLGRPSAHARTMPQIGEDEEMDRVEAGEFDDFAGDDNDSQGSSPSVKSFASFASMASMASLTLGELQALEVASTQYNMADGQKLTVETLLEAANAKYATCDTLSATWVNWLLCLSFGIEALTIGYNLSIGPIFLLQEFDKGTGMIGVLFAVGAASGSIAAIGITCTACGQALMKKLVHKSPYDLCFAMFGIAVGVLVAAVPNFVVHVMGLVLLMCFNDLGATLMTELQGSITTVNNFSLLGPLGQVVRRTLNCVTALTGPVLYGVFPRLPYFVAGGVTLMWTCGLVIAFKVRRRQTLKDIAERTGQAKELIKMEMSFATGEVVMSMLPVVMELKQQDEANANNNNGNNADAPDHQRRQQPMQALSAPASNSQQPRKPKFQQRKPTFQSGAKNQTLTMYDPDEVDLRRPQPKAPTGGMSVTDEITV